MATLFKLGSDKTMKTANEGEGLTWLSNGQVIATLIDGTVLSVKRDALGDCQWTTKPAGTQGETEKAWPHPAGSKPPSFLSYYPDEKPDGLGVGYQR